MAVFRTGEAAVAKPAFSAGQTTVETGEAGSSTDEAGTVPIRIDFRKTWVSRSPAIIFSEISHKPPCFRLHAIRGFSQNTVFQGLCH